MAVKIGNNIVDPENETVSEEEFDKHDSQIGRLKVEVDWLKKRPDISIEHD